MKAAVVEGPGRAPVYAEFPAPAPGEGERLVKVTAAALSPLARGRAAGRHYSSEGQYPFVAGVDGVGRLADGTRVYFLMPRAPWGAFAELAAAPAAQCVPLPADLDDETAAAIANPGMSSWAALVERAKLQQGETVLVNGATGAAGRLAVRIARRLGAGKVIATGRNADALATLGADATIALVDDDEALETRLRAAFAETVDVVLDYLWGRSAERLLIAAAKAAPKRIPLRFVQIGSASGATLPLLSDVLRATPIEMMGSGLGSVPPARFVAAIAALFEAAKPAGLVAPMRMAPLADVEAAWTQAGDGRRIVFTIGG